MRFPRFCFFILSLLTHEKLAGIQTGANAVLVFLFLVVVAGVFIFYYKRWLASFMRVSYLALFHHAKRILAIALAVALLGETVTVFEWLFFIPILAGTLIASHGEGAAARNT